ncbi:GntR family transcriptional regulator [Nocardia seriolae]|uniref:GntR family transcriptional regulator n=1 Tax=Nocardia seriolae TaxID=37332 RepID=A0A0B8NGP7_9NOCA|nr:GntR family transcriptional regulator [Nocardia seriolae]MTJ60456.1 GntR family transcriptional regulator [Nocardia seriolae]MTJ72492.1 GntR family transcriptional regulator [Nocardia seriolae]MTJ84656.1 GntR family transcriptional regulator [Nocardia seriolae]MTK28644.1 GntR family transcriptional regulator [Nocardia seriolae]MTK38438.1 GntR family transcriptional regulator [Nocardia seriolae]
MNARRGRIPLSERVYRALQRDLAAGVLVPTERLGEERLAETYGVSRTPVREALARLYADGLLERHTDGLYPYRPRVDELGDLYELRIVLEARGIQRLQTTPSSPPESPTTATREAPATSIAAALPRGGAPDTTAVREELEAWRRIREHPPEPGAALIAADEQFHTTLLRAAGNTALADALSTVHARVRPVRALDMPTPGRIAAMADDHIAIAEHLLTGDLDTALRTLLAHLTSSRAHVLTRARRALELTKLAQAVRE